jgi:hypothetical protein
MVAAFLAALFLDGRRRGPTRLAVEQTVTDAQRRFAFDDLPIEPGLIYRPVANRGGVHYPGPRIQFRAGAVQQPTSRRPKDHKTDAK